MDDSVLEKSALFKNIPAKELRPLLDAQGIIAYEPPVIDILDPEALQMVLSR